MSLLILPVRISSDILPRDDIIKKLLATENGKTIKDGDILVFTQKIISKQEGLKIDLSKVKPTLLATGIASAYAKDSRIVQLILNETKRLVRMKNGIIISQTKSGLVCANAGIDESNVEEGYATLLPRDPDKSAQRLRRQIRTRIEKDVAVIISDTFGRPFREGQTDVAIGLSGITAILDYAGKRDGLNKMLRVTAIAIADEVASASELVRGKSELTPIAIVRNYKFDKKNDTMKKLLRKKSIDLFR